MSFLDRALARRQDVEKQPARKLGLGTFNFGGVNYPYGVNQTLVGSGMAPIAPGFVSLVDGAYKSSAPVASVVDVRVNILSQIRFLWRPMENGRPGKMFSTADLEILQRPWPGGTTQTLVAQMEQHNSLAGNAFVVRRDDRLVVLRPDYVTVVRASIKETDDSLDAVFVGILYQEPNQDPIPIPADEVCHWMPKPDPLTPYRGMSWITPVLPQVQSHRAATDHKWNFFKSGATPNMVIKFDPKMAAEQVQSFAAIFEDEYVGEHNAYKTMFLGGGADVSVVGTDFQQMDFKQVQGADETAIASASGVGPIMAQFSEGLSGSSLNQGNYNSAKRLVGDVLLSSLGGSLAASLERIVKKPGGSGVHLWWDTRDVPFFRQDAKDEAEIHALEATTMRTLVDGGFEPKTVIEAVASGDMSLVKHSYLVSVQLQPPGVAPKPTADPAPETDGDSDV